MNFIQDIHEHPDVGIHKGVNKTQDSIMQRITGEI